jgi:DNA-binding NarL/FixJ family response regulator
MKEPLRVLIVKADRLCAEILRRSVTSAFPEASVALAHRLAGANAALSAESFDLLISGIAMPDGDMLDLLAAVLGDARRVDRALIVTGRRESHIFESLRALPIDGLLDTASEGLREFDAAVRSVMAGVPYWSPAVRSLLLQCMTPTAICRRLTPTEQVVFSVLGGGLDDELAAAELGMTASAVHGVRRDLHRKLKIQHRGDLMRVAAQTGFVRFSSECVSHPAFAILLSQCSSRKIPQAAQRVTMELPSASCAMF